MIESDDNYKRIFDAVAHIRAHMLARTGLEPRVGVILGSGLGAFASQVENAATTEYALIPHFPRSAVVGHSGTLSLGEIAGVRVAVLQGRVHAYEGCSMAEVTFSTRVLGLLGCRTLIVTNAAGGLHPEYQTGTLVAISDHINLTGQNALVGPNDKRFGMIPGSGQRFFDMSAAYSPALRALAKEEAAKQGYVLEEGVYAGVLGPSFETPAEIRAFRTLGADLVGMSTVHEVTVARHMGIEVLGLSLVTNSAAGVSEQTIDHGEVLEAGRRAADRFAALLSAVIARI